MKAEWNHISGKIPHWASSTNFKVFTSREWFEATDPGALLSNMSN
jgi:hypothetical protein